MSAEIKGKAAIWTGLGGIACTGLVISSTTGKVQDANVSYTAEKAFVKDEVGDDVSMAVYNKGRTMQITVIPFSTTTGSAVVSLNGMLPDIGSQVTVTDSYTPTLSGSQAGKWYLDDLSVNRSNSSFVSVNFTLSQRKDNDISTTVA